MNKSIYMLFRITILLLSGTLLLADSIEINKNKVFNVEVTTIVNSYSFGSAVLISNKGNFVTAYHVISDAKTIEVIDKTGKRHSAAIGKVSIEDDLAYLHINNFYNEAVHMDTNISWSEDIYSLSGKGLLLKGIISGKDEKIILNYKVPQGNSGGGVFNKKGNLIAIISKSSINGGITYATTVNNFKNITSDFEYKKSINLKSNNHDYSYCSTSKTLNTWKNLTESDDIQMHTLHAIFLGLCEKVKRKDLTTEEADYIFLLNRKRLFDL
jgi:hypothetical protein